MKSRPTIQDIEHKVARRPGSTKGVHYVDLSNDEIYVIIEANAKRSLGISASEAIEICRSGKWKTKKKKRHVWSWLRHVVSLLPLDYSWEEPDL